MIFDTIVIRNELKQNEFRTPIVPEDIKILVLNKFRVFIENSSDRCFLTNEYIKNGAILISHDDIYDLDEKKTLIVGLKDLDINDENVFKFSHIYFSHTYKNQLGSEEILKKFKNKNGKIYDLEYITDSQNNRIVHFGYYAGFIGTFLGIQQYIKKLNNDNLFNLKPIFDIDNKILKLKNELTTIKQKLKIAVIGSNGRCGNGSSCILKLLGLFFDEFNRYDNKEKLCDYDIIINCIFLNKTDIIKPFIDLTTINKFNNCVIVDVSCDYNSDNNPIKIYNNATSHENPVVHINNIDLIAIDNLPTLIPIESSIFFSNKLVNLLTQINDFTNEIWNNCVNAYYEKIKNQ